MTDRTWRRVRVIALTVLMALVAAVTLPAAGIQAHDHAAGAPEVIKALGITAGSYVADVGSGAGAFTVPLAKAVGPTGRVYAVDIDERILEKLRARIEREGLQNVEIIKGDVDNPKLPAGALDG